MTHRWHTYAVVGLLCFTSVTTGCINRLAGGSMRIDVEVYKGPLSQEPEIQWGELVGYLEEAKRGIVEVTNSILVVVQGQQFPSLKSATAEHSVPIDIRQILNAPTRCANFQGDTCPAVQYLNVPVHMKDMTAETSTRVTWCDSLPKSNSGEFEKFENCTSLRGLYIDGVGLIQELDEALSKHGDVLHQDKPAFDKAEAALREVSEVASQFRAKAFFWVVSGTSGLSRDQSVRIAIADFIIAASEYGNQLQSRSDSLMKQHGKWGRDRRELPLSVHLRDTQPTDFIHLFDWLNAAEGGWFFDTVDDRISVVKRLFADRFWAKINTVYASGAGKIRMAFVKDGIGNWDLKDFDNAPAELLESYAVVAKELAKRAIQLAQSSNPGSATLTGVSTLLEGAKQAMTVSADLKPTSDGQDLHASGELLATKARLLLERRSLQDQELSDRYKKLATGEATEKEEAREALGALQSYRRGTLEQLKALAKDHGEFLDLYAASVRVP